MLDVEIVIQKDTTTKPTERNETLHIPRKIYSETR
jgi:hypothetical protein